MNNNKARRVLETLEYYFPSPVPIPLDSRDDFTMLCAVVLSAQTTDGKVNAVTQELFSRAGDPNTLANLPYDDLLSMIKSVGLAPSKTKYLIGLARKIVDEHCGRVPRTYAELEALPGVGHKTASVVMSQAFGEPAFPVDTHIHRLANRWGLSGGSVKDVEAVFKATFPREVWNKLHLQLIYFGREYCAAKNHIATRCPICSWVNTPNAAGPATDDPLRAPKAKNIIYYSDRRLELASRHRLEGEEDTTTTPDSSSSSSAGAGSSSNARKSTAGAGTKKRGGDNFLINDLRLEKRARNVRRTAPARAANAAKTTAAKRAKGKSAAGKKKKQRGRVAVENSEEQSPTTRPKRSRRKK